METVRQLISDRQPARLIRYEASLELHRGIREQKIVLSTASFTVQKGAAYQCFAAFLCL
jgi:hypothetical protein